MASNSLEIKVIGRVKIGDELDSYNSINAANLSTLIGRGLTNAADQNIFKLKIGAGGQNADSSLRPHRSSAIDTDLYSSLNSRTVVLDQQSEDASEGCSTTFSVVESGSIVIVNTAVIVNPLSASESLTFNELGLFSADDLMLSHVTFNSVSVQPGSSKTITYSVSFSIQA
jgi:hypothetical protein